jgi:hypothetical protein
MVCVVCDNCVTRNEKINLGQRLRKHESLIRDDLGNRVLALSADGRC